MASSAIRAAEVAVQLYPWERVFVLPLDEDSGDYRILHVDPLDFDDVRDNIYCTFNDLWGNV